VSAILEFLPQIVKIVNASIEDEADLTIFGQHGLMACRAEIQNRQPSMTQQSIGPAFDPFRVRTATSQRGDHRPQRLLTRFACSCCDKTGNATHMLIVAKSWNSRERTPT
jgi:hypothetical protein